MKHIGGDASMTAYNGPNKAFKFWFIFLAALLAIAPALIMQCFQGARAADGESAVATYSHGALRVVIPFHAPHAGAGRLTLEVLDPEDQVVGRSERRVTVGNGNGQWQGDLRPA